MSASRSSLRRYTYWLCVTSEAFGANMTSTGAALAGDGFDETLCVDSTFPIPISRKRESKNDTWPRSTLILCRRCAMLSLDQCSDELCDSVRHFLLEIVEVHSKLSPLDPFHSSTIDH